VGNRTIEIGIDLGTTNSAVAINYQGNIEIVKKPGGVEYTPSVFGFDKSKNKIVGHRAYELLFSDTPEQSANNFKPEIKRVIGTPEKFYFPRADIAMSAEEISAEILKSLIQDILRKYPDFDTSAAVVTIPAAFSVLQCEATKRAGEIAGIAHVVLLQEPIAAAVACGFGKNKSEHWLIYDLGGGTFDVALVSSREGILNVLGHSGDNFLGGKNLDWEMVDKFVIPRLKSEYTLLDFRRDSDAHRGKFLRLKYLAEKAKIELSQYDTTTMEIDGIGSDDSGKPISLSIKLSGGDIEDLMEPLIDRTIDLCKATLRETGLNPTAVSKIILVGGPTQSPYIRQKLERELGIKTDSSVDPLTVVAQGACIFAQSQIIPEALDRRAIPKKAGALNVTLNHETLSASVQQTVSGIVQELVNTSAPFFVQIQSENGTFVSEKIRVNQGRFFTNVILQPNKPNLFWVYLFDEQGNDIPLNTESFNITHGITISGAPIPHSIGIAVAYGRLEDMKSYSEKFEKLIEKGEVLPASRTERFRTVRDLKRSEKENPLWIRVGEGESEILDRNTFVCELSIRGSDLPKDLPKGTDLDVTVAINEARELSVTAYVPLIDLTLDARYTFVDETIDLGNLETEVGGQRARAAAVISNCSPEQVTKIERSLRAVSSSVQNARLDEDEKRKAVKEVKDLKLLLDDAEKVTEFSQLSKNFYEGMFHVQQIIENAPDKVDRDHFVRQFAEIKVEGERAIERGDKSLLIGLNDRLRELGGRALYSDPATWRYEFEKLVSSDHQFINSREADYFIQKGKDAINKGDVEELKRCCGALHNLLPLQEQQRPKINRPGITR
jgi:molecular chaperone DnaK